MKLKQFRFLIITILCCLSIVVNAEETKTQALSDIEIKSEYTAGTIVSTFTNNKVSYRFVDGRMKGAFAKDLDYSSFKIGDDLYFVRYHDPNSHNYFTLVIDLKNKLEYTSAIMFYTEDYSNNFITEGKIASYKRLE